MEITLTTAPVSISKLVGMPLRDNYTIQELSWSQGRPLVKVPMKVTSFSGGFSVWNSDVLADLQAD